jgi:hypothetical protein
VSDVSAATWTNSSVLTFAAGKDPLTAASEAAEGLLSRAKEANLAGPPVDVITLVEELGIELRPNDDVLDARIVSASGGQLIIEFNPNRPRGRIRYSIAHELAHSCFPDVADQPRHRTALGAVVDPDDDNWELELICNVIAAELLVPERALEGLLETEPDIDFIMEARRRWDVSTEALLRQFVARTRRPLTLLALSRRRYGQDESFVVDYADLSSSEADDDSPLQMTHGDVIERNPDLRAVVAVGQTRKTDWEIGGQQFIAQMVGAPGFPGSRFPRVFVLLERPSTDNRVEGVEYVTGDLLEYGEGHEAVIVAHVVSDSSHSWGRFGVANRLSRAYPDFGQAFRAWTIADPDNLDLGHVHQIDRLIDDRRITVASMVAQAGFGRRWESRLRYDALRDCLRTVANAALTQRAAVHLPRIGAGQAGGRWDYIERVIVDELVDRGVRVVVHTLPGDMAKR